MRKLIHLREYFHNFLCSQVLEDDVEINENKTKRWEGWDINDGYAEPAYIPVIEDLKETEKILENEPLPRRVIAAGLHAGLTVALNVEKDEYYCSGSESVGFKVSKNQTFVVLKVNQIKAKYPIPLFESLLLSRF